MLLKMQILEFDTMELGICNKQRPRDNCLFWQKFCRTHGPIRMIIGLLLFAGCWQRVRLFTRRKDQATFE